MRRFLCILAIGLACLVHGQVAVYADLVYTQASGFPQKLDLYLPTAPSEPRAAIVFIHGGGWSAGDKADFAGFAQYYAQLGFVCVSINYRLTPIHVWPAQINDSQAAVRWVRKWSAVLNVNPQRIGSLGGSAGGHLALILGQVETLHDFDPELSGYSSRVQAVADYFGPTDLTNREDWDPWVWLLIRDLLGASGLRHKVANPRVASPLFLATRSDAPSLLLHGDLDTIVRVEQSRRLVARKLALGSVVEYHEYSGEGHGFSEGPFWASVNAITSFFGRHL